MVVSIDKNQKIGLVALSVSLVGFILFLFNLDKIKYGNLAIFIGLGLISFACLISLLMILPWKVKVQIEEEHINLYRKHIREVEIRIDYKDIIKAYFNYLDNEIGLVIKENGERIFININGKTVENHPRLKEKIKEKDIEIEKGSKPQNYGNHDEDFNRKVNRIKKNCDKDITI